MATNLELTVEALDRRVTAIEERLNLLQTMLQNASSSRALAATTVLLEDSIKLVKAATDANQAEIDLIKTRLGM